MGPLGQGHRIAHHAPVRHRPAAHVQAREDQPLPEDVVVLQDGHGDEWLGPVRQLAADEVFFHEAFHQPAGHVDLGQGQVPLLPGPADALQRRRHQGLEDPQLGGHGQVLRHHGPEGLQIQIQ